MKILKKILLTLLIIIILYAIGRLAVVSYDSYVFLPRQPYLQTQTDNSIRIKWQSPQSEIGCVKYGLKTTSNTLCEKEATKSHSLTLKGLQADTTYLYEVSSDSLQIDNTNRHFKTLSHSKEKTQYIWIIGDSGDTGKGQADVYEAMQTYMQDKPLDLWLLLGDNAYRSGSQKQYNKAFFTPYAHLLKTNVPWAVIGNHDARRWAFYDIFDFPMQSESGGLPSGSEKYYAIDSGNVHLIMLDSETTDLNPGSKLFTWLEKDLQANQQQWTIVALHHPPYTDGGHNSDNPRDSHYKLSMQGRLFLVRENLLPLLEKYDVDLVFSGHSHVYERSKLMHKHYQDSTHFDPKKHLIQESQNSYCKAKEKAPFAGTIYTVMGSSAKKDQGRLKHPALPFAFSELGSVILEVNEESITSSFINDKAEVKDSFTLTKKEHCP